MVEFFDTTKNVNGVCRITVPKELNVPIGARVRVNVEILDAKFKQKFE